MGKSNKGSELKTENVAGNQEDLDPSKNEGGGPVANKGSGRRRGWVTWEKNDDVRKTLNRVFNLLSVGEPDYYHPDFDVIWAGLPKGGRLHQFAKAVNGPCAGEFLPWRKLSSNDANAMAAIITRWGDLNDKTLESEMTKMREEMNMLLDYLQKHGHDPVRRGNA